MSKVKLSVKHIERLYYKEQLSIREIARKIGVSQWKVIHFMKKNKLPRRSFREANKIKFERKERSFNPKDRLSTKERDLKIAGIMLYWTEGAKINPERRWYTLDFSNSDPRMVKLFLKFLREICGINEQKLRVYLYCYANQRCGKINKLLEQSYEYFSKTISEAICEARFFS